MSTNTSTAPATPPAITPAHAMYKKFLALGASTELARRGAAWHDFLQEQQVQVLIYCVYRSPDEQARLYAVGRTAPGKIVTNARPGKSKHNRNLLGVPSSDAFDACPIIDGRPTWATTGRALLAWREMRSAAYKAGLLWGGDFQSIRGDWSHFEFSRPTPSTGA